MRNNIVIFVLSLVLVSIIAVDIITYYKNGEVTTSGATENTYTFSEMRTMPYLATLSDGDMWYDRDLNKWFLVLGDSVLIFEVKRRATKECEE